MQLSLLEQLFQKPGSPAKHIDGLTRDDLKSYLPEASISYILEWFSKNPVRLRIASSRSSKFGDYKYAKPGTPASISVNNNLNKYEFLLTLVHEMAHDVVFSAVPVNGKNGHLHSRKKSPKPHGTEWKESYYALMKPLLKPSVFPQDILSPLLLSFSGTVSAVKANQSLEMALKKYDTPDGREFIKDLPEGTIFYLPSGRAFQKQQRGRKRFRCKCLDNRRIYLFTPMFPVLRKRP
jgi:SprT protein